jgi:hypothetical protein
MPRHAARSRSPFTFSLPPPLQLPPLPPLPTFSRSEARSLAGSDASGRELAVRSRAQSLSVYPVGPLHALDAAAVTLELLPLPPLPNWVRSHAEAVPQGVDSHGKTSSAFAAGSDVSGGELAARSWAPSPVPYPDAPWRAVKASRVIQSNSDSGAAEHANYNVVVSDDAIVTDEDRDSALDSSSDDVVKNTSSQPASRTRARSSSSDYSDASFGTVEANAVTRSKSDSDAAEHAERSQAARSSKSASAAKPLQISNETCWERAFTFMSLYEHIYGRPPGPINCLAFVAKPQLHMNQVQREIISVICDQLLQGLSKSRAAEHGVIEKTRSLISSMISIMKIRAFFQR